MQATTGFITNPPCIAHALEPFQCRNRGRGGPCRHQHLQLLNDRAKHKANYPPELVAAILSGMRQQLQQDKREHVEIGGTKVGCISSVSMDEGYNDDLATRDMLHCPEYEHIFDQVFDDVTGAHLPPELVKEARLTEIEFSRSYPDYKHIAGEEGRG